MEPTTAVLTAEKLSLSLSDFALAKLTIRGQSPLRVSVRDNPLDRDSSPLWKIQAIGPAQRTTLPGGREEWQQTYRLDPYVPGEAVGLGFMPVGVQAGSELEVKNLEPAPLRFRITTQATADLKTLRPLAGTEAPPQISDTPVATNWQLSTLSGFAVGIVLLMLVVLRRRRPPVVLSPEELLEAALSRASQLANNPLAALQELEAGIRLFVEQTLALPATRMTARELVDVLKQRDSAGKIALVLEASEKIRFAQESCTLDRLMKLISTTREWAAEVNPRLLDHKSK